MQKKFEFEFEDLSAKNAITFDYDDKDDLDEALEVVIENGMPVLYANRKALMALAKAFIKIAVCEYPVGFHVHLSKNFDADQKETLRCVLSK
jgi:hypothetical protein